MPGNPSRQHYLLLWRRYIFSSIDNTASGTVSYNTNYGVAICISTISNYTADNFSALVTNIQTTNVLTNGVFAALIWCETNIGKLYWVSIGTNSTPRCSELL